MRTHYHQQQVLDAANAKLAGQLQPSVELLSAAVGGEWFTNQSRDRSAASESFSELAELGWDIADDAIEDLSKIIAAEQKQLENTQLPAASEAN